MLLSSSVNTPIDNNRSHLMALPCASCVNRVLGQSTTTTTTVWLKQVAWLGSLKRRGIKNHSPILVESQICCLWSQRCSQLSAIVGRLSIISGRIFLQNSSTPSQYFRYFPVKIDTFSSWDAECNVERKTLRHCFLGYNGFAFGFYAEDSGFACSRKLI